MSFLSRPNLNFILCIAVITFIAALAGDFSILAAGVLIGVTLRVTSAAINGCWYALFGAPLSNE